MTSEEAYAEKRGIFTQWAEQQIASGKFVTELKSVVEKQEATNERQTRNIPVIKYGTDGLPIQRGSDFKMYGIKVNGFQITDWDFEQKTLDQISRKREATMGIITAKADAERARQEALTAEEQGKKKRHGRPLRQGTGKNPGCGGCGKRKGSRRDQSQTIGVSR